MACSSARAFSQSLLEARGGGGCDGPTPSTAEVVGEHRFLCGVPSQESCFFDFDVTAISISFGQKKYFFF